MRRAVPGVMADGQTSRLSGHPCGPHPLRPDRLDHRQDQNTNQGSVLARRPPARVKAYVFRSSCRDRRSPHGMARRRNRRCRRVREAPVWRPRTGTTALKAALSGSRCRRICRSARRRKMRSAPRWLRRIRRNGIRISACFFRPHRVGLVFPAYSSSAL